MKAPIVEPSVIIDTFCTDLVRVEQLGPCTRLTFAVQQANDGQECGQEKVIVAKLMISTEVAQALFRREQLIVTAPAARLEESETPKHLN